MTQSPLIAALCEETAGLCTVRELAHAVHENKMIASELTFQHADKHYHVELILKKVKELPK